MLYFVHTNACEKAIIFFKSFDSRRNFWSIDQTDAAEYDCNCLSSTNWRVQQAEKVSALETEEAPNEWQNQREIVGRFIGLGAEDIDEDYPEIGEFGALNYNWCDFIDGPTGIIFEEVPDVDFMESLESAKECSLNILQALAVNQPKFKKNWLSVKEIKKGSVRTMKMLVEVQVVLV